MRRFLQLFKSCRLGLGKQKIGQAYDALLGCLVWDREEVYSLGEVQVQCAREETEGSKQLGAI